jgi:hypothetical protein
VGHFTPHFSGAMRYFFNCLEKQNKTYPSSIFRASQVFCALGLGIHGVGILVLGLLHLWTNKEMQPWRRNSEALVSAKEHQATKSAMHGV